MRSPLFVFLTRQFSQPHLRHEERFSFFVPIAEWRENIGAPHFFVALYGAPQQERRREEEMGPFSS